PRHHSRVAIRRVRDLGARLSVRAVGEPRGIAGTRLDRDAEAVADESLNRLRDERDAALAGSRLTGHRDSHRPRSDEKGSVAAPGTHCACPDSLAPPQRGMSATRT